MKTLEERYPVEEVELLGRKWQQQGFMALWERAWYWMDKWGIPLDKWQKDRITGLVLDESEPTKESLRHEITLRFENIPKDKRPPEYSELIHNHMVEMMNLWGWPEWGFREVKHLKPQEQP